MIGYEGRCGRKVGKQVNSCSAVTAGRSCRREGRHCSPPSLLPPPCSPHTLLLIHFKSLNLNLKLRIISPPSAPPSCPPFTLLLKILNLKSLDLKLRIISPPSLPPGHSFCTFLLLKNLKILSCSSPPAPSAPRHQ